MRRLPALIRSPVSIRMNIRLALPLAAAVTLAFLTFSPAVRAQAPGTLDFSFDPGAGTDASVYAVAVQRDGRVLAGGSFTNALGTGRNRIVRLNTNGSLDTSFNPGAGPDNDVDAIAVQSDGRIVLGGEFIGVGGLAPSRIARLNVNGTLDGSFAPSPGANFSVFTLTLQGDGKILLGGGFSSVNGFGRQSLARLNSNGTVDTAFNPNLYGTSNPTVLATALQRDGKIVVGGNFTQVGGFARNYFARLNADGSLDAAFDFNLGFGPDGIVHSVAIQPDGKILLGGEFITFNGFARSHILRLNPDGTMDDTFDPGLGPDFSVNALAVQTNERIVIGGSFASVDGVTQPFLARLNADGSFDASFDPGIGPDRRVTSIALQDNGQIVIGGDFISFNGTGRNHIARLNGDGGHPAFFTGEVFLGNGIYYLQTANNVPFGYYSYLTDPHYIYHFDLGYEYLFDARDGVRGLYLYDFTSANFFYTSPGFGFPYLYDFGLDSVLYYFSDAARSGHYTTAPRYFYDFVTGTIITR